jgi:hypothetical protein
MVLVAQEIARGQRIYDYLSLKTLHFVKPFSFSYDFSCDVVAMVFLNFANPNWWMA